ncbi:MAG TPA: hypothetical protein VNZ64_01335 [Candidatus Acidoferrum sp.]|nr:hypothetical protein [Candidatus Acidoferrum sp.]
MAPVAHDDFEARHPAASVKDFVWYRLFKWRKNPFTGPWAIKHLRLLNLPGGYVIDFSSRAVREILATLEKSQNPQPLEKRIAKRLRFYQRWLDPVILPTGKCVLALLLLADALIHLHRKQKAQKNRHAEHPQPATSSLPHLR